MTRTIWLNGQTLEPGDAHAPFLAHALHYGTGVFEGIRSYQTARGPAIFRLREHMDRMKRGADALAMSLDADRLGQVIRAHLADSGMGDAYIRPLAFYATGGLMLDVAALSPQVGVALIASRSHLGDDAGRAGVRVTISSLARISARSVPPLKLCGNYVNSILAKLEATRRGFDEALLLDAAGAVCEATGENLFVVRKGRVTACVHPDALPGITRASIVELTGADEAPLTRDEMLSADEVFLTGTSAEVAPVCEIDGRRFAVGPITREAQVLYREAVTGLIPAKDSWLTYAA